MSERLKHTSYEQRYLSRYFWRTKEQHEIDYIEDYDGVLHAYEIKWKRDKISTPPKTFRQAYHEYQFETITSSNFQKFLTGDL